MLIQNIYVCTHCIDTVQYNYWQVQVIKEYTSDAWKMHSKSKQYYTLLVYNHANCGWHSGVRAHHSHILFYSKKQKLIMYSYITGITWCH